MHVYESALNLQSILNKAVNHSGSNPPGKYSVCYSVCHLHPFPVPGQQRDSKARA